MQTCVFWDKSMQNLLITNIYWSAAPFYVVWDFYSGFSGKVSTMFQKFVKTLWEKKLQIKVSTKFVIIIIFIIIIIIITFIIIIIIIIIIISIISIIYRWKKIVAITQKKIAN